MFGKVGVKLGILGSNNPQKAKILKELTEIVV